MHVSCTVNGSALSILNKTNSAAMGQF